VSGNPNNIHGNKISTWTRATARLRWRFFFYAQFLIHNEFNPEGRTENKEMYVEILHRFRNAMRIKHQEKWARNG
jgi:hypothetical protein